VDVMTIHDSISIKSPLGEGGRDMTEGNNPTDRSNLGQAKRQILTDKKGIPLSVHNVCKPPRLKSSNKDVIDNIVLNQRPSGLHFTKNKTRKQSINRIYALIKSI
jgi:hypothetical protein